MSNIHRNCTLCLVDDKGKILKEFKKYSLREIDGITLEMANKLELFDYLIDEIQTDDSKSLDEKKDFLKYSSKLVKNPDKWDFVIKYIPEKKTQKYDKKHIKTLKVVYNTKSFLEEQIKNPVTSLITKKDLKETIKKLENKENHNNIYRALQMAASFYFKRHKMDYMYLNETIFTDYIASHIHYLKEHPKRANQTTRIAWDAVIRQTRLGLASKTEDLSNLHFGLLKKHVDFENKKSSSKYKYYQIVRGIYVASKEYDDKLRAKKIKEQQEIAERVKQDRSRQSRISSIKAVNHRANSETLDNQMSIFGETEKPRYK